jgi:hypothetical protein
MTDDGRSEAPLDAPLDATDQHLLDQVAEVLELADPVPHDLVERVQFAVALDEVFAEVAHITRVADDALAVRSDPTAEVRTETLTFSADRLTAMVTVTRTADGTLRVDGWVAPEEPMRVHLRMQGGPEFESTDAAGRFVFEGLSEGFAQLSFHLLGGAGDPEPVVVTPLFQL